VLFSAGAPSGTYVPGKQYDLNGGSVVITGGGSLDGGSCSPAQAKAGGALWTAPAAGSGSITIAAVTASYYGSGVTLEVRTLSEGQPFGLVVVQRAA
jgi:hypothetical protein